VDEVARWWAAVISLAAYWLTGDDEAAHRLYPTVDALPKQLYNNDEPLARSVYLAYKARKTFFTGGTAACPRHVSCIRQCDRAGELLRESLSLDSKTPPTSTSQRSLQQAVQLLVCDWLLSTRTAIWQEENDSQSDDCTEPHTASPAELQAFQQDLASLRALCQHVRAALPRVFLLEATARLMAGASPTRTQQLLHTAATLRHRHHSHQHQHAEYEDGDDSDEHSESGGSNGSVGEREYATALVLACRHLPSQLLSSPGQRSSMLSQAAQTYERLGDRKALQDCRNMMMKCTNSMQQHTAPIPITC